VFTTLFLRLGGMHRLRDIGQEMGHDPEGAAGLASPSLLEMVNRAPVPDAHRLGGPTCRTSVWSPVMPLVIAGIGDTPNTVRIIRGPERDPEPDPARFWPNGLHGL
jgi:hypothetical protein